MKSFKLAKILFLAFFWIIAITNTVVADNYYSVSDSSHGFWIKKIAVSTTIETGTWFSYTIHFRIPGGAVNVKIRDVLPTNLIYSSYNFSQGPSTIPQPVITTPTSGSSGTFELNWASVPEECTGMIEMTVKFPEGITCNGRFADNRVCMSGRLGSFAIDFCTKFVRTTAQADDPWYIKKDILGASHQEPPCDHITLDSIVQYQICCRNDYGSAGHLNIFNAVVTDNLPQGATLVPGSPSCTNMSQPGGPGTPIIWNVGNLTVTTNGLCCTFKVLYPRAFFPTGTEIPNQAVLTGSLGSPADNCGNITHPSNITCIDIDTVAANPLLSLTKQNFIASVQPGCQGFYRIRICNIGNTNITTATLTDQIPAYLTGLSIANISTGLSVSLVGTIATATFSTPLTPNSCRIFEIKYTISPSVPIGQEIINCAILVSPGLTTLQNCINMKVVAPTTNVNLYKTICNYQSSYTPGQTVRFRIRVQNLGGLAVQNAIISDQLDQSFDYSVSSGNESFYSSTNWNPPCQGSSNWNPTPGILWDPSTKLLKFNQVNIPATCDGSTALYYFIEFDVKVADTASIGTVPNKATIYSGGINGQIQSNNCWIHIVGVAGFELEKSMSHDTTNWSQSATVSAGSTINYRLKLKVLPGRLAMRHVTFVDLLPKDNTPNAPSDKRILLPHVARGSSFGVTYNSTWLTSPAATLYSTLNGNGSEADVNNFKPVNCPSYPFNPLGAGAQTNPWITGPITVANNKNFGYYFGYQAIGATNPAIAVFKVNIQTPIASSDTISCNTFAANGFIRYFINGSTIVDEFYAPMESPKVCVTVEPGQTQDTTQDCCDKVTIDPYTHPDETRSCRAITVYNIKIPASPITYIDIKYSDCSLNTQITDNGTLNQLSGGQPRLFRVSPYNHLDLFPPPNSWFSAIDHFQRLPFTGHVPPFLPAYGAPLSTYQNTITFNLSLPFESVPNLWCVKFIIHHEDNDSCIVDIPQWDTRYSIPGQGPLPVLDTNNSTHTGKVIHVVGLTIDRSKSMKRQAGYISVSTMDPRDEIIGGSGGIWTSALDYDTLCINSKFVQSQHDALFTLTDDNRNGKFNVFISSPKGTKNVMLKTVIYDNHAAVISRDTMVSNIIVSDVDPVYKTMIIDEGMSINSIIPNPATGIFSVDFSLIKDEFITLELFNPIGESVGLVTDGFHIAGNHKINFDTGLLSSGRYLLKLSSKLGKVTTFVTIIH